MCLYHACCLIIDIVGKLDIFPLMCALKKSRSELALIHKNIRSVRNSHAQVNLSIWHKTHYDVTDKNNNVSSEDRHYHKYPSSYWTRWDIGDNVCLNLQNYAILYLLCVKIKKKIYKSWINFIIIKFIRININITFSDKERQPSINIKISTKIIHNTLDNT